MGRRKAQLIPSFARGGNRAKVFSIRSSSRRGAVNTNLKDKEGFFLWLSLSTPLSPFLISFYFPFLFILPRLPLQNLILFLISHSSPPYSFLSLLTLSPQPPFDLSFFPFPILFPLPLPPSNPPSLFLPFSFAPCDTYLTRPRLQATDACYRSRVFWDKIM